MANCNSCQQGRYCMERSRKYRCSNYKRRRGRKMHKNYRGAYERTADRMISEQTPRIEINWINMSAKESGSGGADRITKKLLDAGYLPDGAICAQSHRSAYVRGEKLNGRYIRMPQEIWVKTETPAVGTARESK